MSEHHAAQQALAQLLDIMAQLRHPRHGCPWDLEQTIATIAPHTLEEVYEVLDAIESGDMMQLEGELGDLLFQIVFYAQLATEQAVFDFAAIANGISAKLRHRHPHVFPTTEQPPFSNSEIAATTDAITADQVALKWEALKAAERQHKQQGKAISALDDVPHALPALLRAHKLQKRAANLGFDWQNQHGVIDKLHEEIGELTHALSVGDAAQVEDELGDVLFTLVNLSRHLELNAEFCLRKANSKFETRFRLMETLARESGVDIETLSEEELDSLWRRVKAAFHSA